MLTSTERIRIGLLSVGMTINGLLQTFSIAILFPFIGFIIEPDAIKSQGWLNNLSRLVGNPAPETFMIWCAITLFITIVIKNLFDLGYNYYFNRFIAAVEQRIAVNLLGECIHAPFDWFLFQNTSILINAMMGDVSVWCRQGMKSFLTLVSTIIMLSSVFVLLIGINPIYGMILIFVGGALNLIMYKLLKPFMRRVAKLKHKGNNQAYKAVNQALSGIKDIKINGQEASFIGQFSYWHKQFVYAAAQLATSQPISSYVYEILVAFILVAVGIAIYLNPSNWAETTTTLAVYGVAIVRIIPVFNQFSSIMNNIQASVPAIENIYRIQSEITPFSHTLQSSTEFKDDWKQIEFDSVSYTYPNSYKPALKHINIIIKRGERIGLVGHSGSGKTTFVDILTGLLMHTGGTILIGENVLSRKNANAWRKQIGYVSQHPFIMDDTLRLNVALENDLNKVDDTRVLKALKAANLGDLLRLDLPEGLDIGLGERGIRLSGGQRQRVAIARALYRNPQMLILDEATSALDSESESEITDALKQISRNTTILVVAHRLSTVKSCDRIIVLEKGEIVGSDTHMNLIRNCSIYRRFVELGDLSIDDVGSDLKPRVAG